MGHCTRRARHTVGTLCMRAHREDRGEGSLGSGRQGTPAPGTPPEIPSSLLESEGQLLVIFITTSCAECIYLFH